jgi:uncharacterized protein (TIGR02266 family)
MPIRICPTPEAARMIQEFLALNRRRVRAGTGLSREEQARWTELRWQIESAMNRSAARHGGRRSSLRVPSNLKVEWNDHNVTDLTSAHEISEGGVFLAMERPLAVGTPLNLRLTGDRGEVVEVEGAVVWSRQRDSGEGPAGVGIEFSTLDPVQREAVAYLVEEALSALAAAEPSE